MSTPATTGSATAVAKKSSPESDMVRILDRMRGQFEAALPKHFTADRMVRLSVTALRTTPKLLECTPASFLAAIMASAQLGLEPNTPLGHAYLIPYGKQCQLIIGYQGMIDLADRSGRIQGRIRAHIVKQGDHFVYEQGLAPKLEHKPSLDAGRPGKPMTHAYAVARVDGEPIFVVLTKAEIDSYRQRSKARGSGPWCTDYDAMALKTCVRRLFTWLPKSIEMARAAQIMETEDAVTTVQMPLDPEVAAALLEAGVQTGEAHIDDADRAALMEKFAAARIADPSLMAETLRSFGIAEDASPEMLATDGLSAVLDAIKERS